MSSTTEADNLLEQFKSTTIKPNETINDLYYRLINQQAILELYGNAHKITDQEVVHQFIHALPTHDNWATFKTQINRTTAPITPRQVLDMAKKHNLQMVKDQHNYNLKMINDNPNFN